MAIRTIETNVTSTSAPAKPEGDTRLYAMGYRYQVTADGEEQANFKRMDQAQKYVDQFAD
jgi:hypothetical protein